MERQRSSSKTANREGTSSESESHDEFEPTSVNNNNGGRRQNPMPAHGKRPADKDSPDEFEHQHDIDRNTGRRQDEKHGHGKRHKADANAGARTKHSTSNTQRRKHVQSTVHQTPNEESKYLTPHLMKTTISKPLSMMPKCHAQTNLFLQKPKKNHPPQT